MQRGAGGFVLLLPNLLYFPTPPLAGVHRNNEKVVEAGNEDTFSLLYFRKWSWTKVIQPVSRPSALTHQAVDA